SLSIVTCAVLLCCALRGAAAAARTKARPIAPKCQRCGVVIVSSLCEPHNREKVKSRVDPHLVESGPNAARRPCQGAQRQTERPGLVSGPGTCCDATGRG